MRMIGRAHIEFSRPSPGSSVTMHGAAFVTEHSPWLATMPLAQHCVLSKPSSPFTAHPLPPVGNRLRSTQHSGRHFISSSVPGGLVFSVVHRTTEIIPHRYTTYRTGCIRLGSRPCRQSCSRRRFQGDRCCTSGLTTERERMARGGCGYRFSTSCHQRSQAGTCRRVFLARVFWEFEKNLPPTTPRILHAMTGVCNDRTCVGKD